MAHDPLIPSLSLENFQTVAMTPGERDWWDNVPGKPGWYAIETDALLSVIAGLPPPREVGKHYRLANRLANAHFLIANRMAITPAHEGALFVVYSGEHENLKARAREHTHGDKGTGCMCLSQYQSLCAYQWKFHYRTCEDHAPSSSGDKLLRSYLEQKWRGEHGWPILCAK
jgi:hypothetical protein